MKSESSTGAEKKSLHRRRERLHDVDRAAPSAAGSFKSEDRVVRRDAQAAALLAVDAGPVPERGLGQAVAVTHLG